MASYNILCSFKKEGSSSKTSEAQKIFMSISGNNVYLTSLEKNGKRGHLIATTTTSAYVRKPINIIFEGLYLRKAVDVFNEDSPEINIYVDNAENPRRVCFMGAGGWANLEVVDVSLPANRDSFSIFGLCNYILGISKEHGTDLDIKQEDVSSYIFDLEYFLSEFATQIPIKNKKVNESDDMVLEIEGSSMHIYKKANTQKRQLAVIPTDSIHNEGTWQKCQIKFPHMHDALKAFLSFVKKEDERARTEYMEEYVPDFVEYTDEDEGKDYDFLDFGYEINSNLSSNDNTHTFRLRQSKRTIGETEVYDLFIESEEYPDFKVRLWMNPLPTSPKETTNA
jgi:hypothetical protein